MKASWIGLLAAICALAAPAQAADNVKIGFITTLSGPAGMIGKHMKDAADLALEHARRQGSAGCRRRSSTATTSSSPMSAARSPTRC